MQRLQYLTIFKENATLEMWIILVIYLNARRLRALAPLGKIIKGVFLLLLKYRLPCWLPHSTDMFVHHFRKWNSCIMKTRWLVICHVLDQIFQKCSDTIFFQNELYWESSNTEYLTNIQIIKFQILTIDCSPCAAALDFSEI